MLPSLPYPGYSWSLSQHMGATNERAVRVMLEGAYLLRGEDDFRVRLAEYLVAEGVFTANVRQDSRRADAWRDYQQVLSLLGLIVSTRTTGSDVVLTPIGLMLLDNTLDFVEVMMTQALRFQYPNGHKDVPPEGRQYARERGISVNRRADLDALFGIRVKPGVLVLRTLLEQAKVQPASAYLTVDEAALALVPVTNHDSPDHLLQRVLNVRRAGGVCDSGVVKRSVSEWFTLLSMTGLFVGDRQTLRLSPIAKSQLDALEALCLHHERNDSFWMPTGDYPAYVADWFVYFGNPAVDAMYVEPTISERPAPEDGWVQVGNGAIGLGLRPYDPETLYVPGPSARPPLDMVAMETGVERRLEQTRLHEEIVALAARRLVDAGYTVQHSRDSVDLLGVSGNHELVVEVKTVTPKSLRSTLRLGVGQLAEYRYRRQIESGHRPDGVLLISAQADIQPWLVDFFESDVDLGLVCRTGGSNFAAYTQGYAATQLLTA